MPAFTFAHALQSAAAPDGVVVARTDVAGLSATGIFHDGPIIDGLPPPDLVFGSSVLPHLDLLDLAVLHPGPIIDGLPPPDLVHDFGVLG
jgi:hypothetical protein